MIPFVVKIDDQKIGRWVLAVQGNRFLVTADDKVLEWVHMSRCQFTTAAPPDAPRPVIVV